MKELIVYYSIRAILWPLAFMPYRMIHLLGNILGHISYYLIPKYRKRALSNLALAKDLNLSFREIPQIAKSSFQNLAINLLEYAKFSREKDIASVVKCQNPALADALYKKGQGMIFFCGHQSNWEVLFLEGNTHLKGVAIGKSIRNKKLYRWILSIREKTGGKIISHQKALKEGVKALKAGKFLGIVGDQGMPEARYSFPFFGRRAWNSPAPALLSYKTGVPIIVATVRRRRGKYFIRYSDPLWPNLTNPLEEEVNRLMNASLTLLQESIRKNIGQWLWQHNRWKQQTPERIYKEYRHDCILVILPDERKKFAYINKHLPLLKQIYNPAFISILAPQKFLQKISIRADEILSYHKLKETLLKDYRFKLVFNFTSYAKINSHFKHLSAFKVLNLNMERNLPEYFKQKLCRPGTI